MHSPEYLLGLSTIDPEFKEILKTTSPCRRLDANTDVAELRQRLRATRKEQVEALTALLEETSFIEEDRQIPVRDGSSITIRIHRPKNPPSGGSPAFVVYHGGGFCLGGLVNETFLCRQWTELGGVAVNVDYRLAPEHPFPTGVNDAFDALQWTASHVDELKINPNKGFLVGGISAGANFASVVSHLYRDEKVSPPLTGVYLSIPPVIPHQTVPGKYKSTYLSYEQNKDAPLLDRDLTQIFDSKFFTPSKKMPSLTKPELYAAKEPSPLATPVLFESHTDLPPTYFQICGLDPLRDEGFIYEDLLKESGVETKTHVYPGLPHAFWAWFPEAKFSQRFVEDCKEGLSWLLGKSP
ncbi:hypothetical protein DSL72_003768 [Monilinia vaccinii-corymbosi]|uniref:Alpha/beta hydrolase fold-3 domain-containing protein n=1 Tax=Monilinia vaccinii-corymbosi TaxID=61207 RepID=A0A8A3P265_9HELO|nr:hypothetical protein DSL72_003768 [Monilinia vaccinii-corymbosi]